MSRTAEDWGRIAVSLPGWEWMPGMRSEINTDTRRAAYRWLAGPSDDRHYGHVVIVEDKHGHACRTLATLQPGPDDVPDPDDPATEGCLIRLLGHARRARQALTAAGHYNEAHRLHIAFMLGKGIGPACIGAAEALGRWPGGGHASNV